jgi:hypothetical protein
MWAIAGFLLPPSTLLTFYRFRTRGAQYASVGAAFVALIFWCIALSIIAPQHLRSDSVSPAWYKLTGMLYVWTVGPVAAFAALCGLIAMPWCVR